MFYVITMILNKSIDSNRDHENNNMNERKKVSMNKTKRIKMNSFFFGQPSY